MICPFRIFWLRWVNNVKLEEKKEILSFKSDVCEDFFLFLNYSRCSAFLKCESTIFFIRTKNIISSEWMCTCVQHFIRNTNWLSFCYRNPIKIWISNIERFENHILYHPSEMSFNLFALKSKWFFVRKRIF